MKFTSTRNTALSVPSAQAIVQGISEEGGLFVPRKLPSAFIGRDLGVCQTQLPRVRRAGHGPVPYGFFARGALADGKRGLCVL